MRGWSVWLLMLTLVGCVSLGLGQPGGPGGSGGTGGQNLPGVKTFQATVSGSHDGIGWSVDLIAELDYETDGGVISGGKNHVRLVDFKTTSDPEALEFEITKLEMKIGGNEITQWPPSNPADKKDITKYFPVRFTSAKFAHASAVTVVIKATFKVRRVTIINSPWSGEFEISATRTVTAHNVALNWQTTVDDQGVSQTHPNSYPMQAQFAGSNQRPILANMKHQVDMPNPTTATASNIAQNWMTKTTFLVPNTHGWPQGLWDSQTGTITLSDMLAARAAGVAAGWPRANMALVMGCFSDQPLGGTLVGTPEFANFGTYGVLWSLCYARTVPNAESSIHPTRPTSALYIEAVWLMADGYFADQIPGQSEVVTGSTYTRNIWYDADTDEGSWIPINLSLFGDPNQRLKHVYMNAAERMFVYPNNNKSLWYLVVEPGNYRGN